MTPHGFPGAVHIARTRVHHSQAQANSSVSVGETMMCIKQGSMCVQWSRHGIYEVAGIAQIHIRSCRCKPSVQSSASSTENCFTCHRRLKKLLAWLKFSLAMYSSNMPTATGSSSGVVDIYDSVAFVNAVAALHARPYASHSNLQFIVQSRFAKAPVHETRLDCVQHPRTGRRRRTPCQALPHAVTHSAKRSACLAGPGS